MTLDPTILRQSFELVIDRRPDLMMRFYEILFERYPELQPMFSRDRTVHAKMFSEAIVAVLVQIEDARGLGAPPGALRWNHARARATSAIYDQVGEALLATLEEVAGQAWTPAIASQWMMAYDAIVSMMQTGEARLAA